jgi:hypothetical protein
VQEAVNLLFHLTVEEVEPVPVLFNLGKPTPLKLRVRLLSFSNH